MTTPAVTHVRAEDLLAEPVQPPLVSVGGLGRRRQLLGVGLMLVVLPVLTVLLDAAGDSLELESEVLLYLLAVVLIAVVGGLAVALCGAILAAFLINYFFIRPVHTLDIDQGEQALALAVFLIVAAVVSGLVEVAARRARAAERAAREAETLSALAGADLEGDESLKGVLDRARNTFHMESVVLKARARPSGDWVDVERAGWAPSGQEEALRFDLPIGTDLRLVGRGPSLFAQDQRVLGAFAAAAQTAYEGHRLSEKARDAREFEAADRQRASLLAAVGHDLRTPLAGIKVAVETLRERDVSLSPDEQAELLSTIEGSVDRLGSIVANLLDASRLQAGSLSVQPQGVALDEVLAAAVLAVPGASQRVVVDVPEDLPLVRADPGLLERVLANLLDNAMRHSPKSEPIEISATVGERSAKLKVVDHGSGIPAGERERIFGAFERGHPESGGGGGVGLGLTVARGFVEAMDGALIADSTDGGGLTLRLRLPLAK